MKDHIYLLWLKLLFELFHPAVIRDNPYYIVAYNRPVPLIPHILERSTAYPREILEVLCDLTYFEIVVSDHKGERGLGMGIIKDLEFLVGLKHKDHMAVAQTVDEQVGKDGEEGPVAHLHIVLALLLNHARLASAHELVDEVLVDLTDELGHQVVDREFQYFCLVVLGKSESSFVDKSNFHGFLKIDLSHEKTLFLIIGVIVSKLGGCTSLICHLIDFHVLEVLSCLVLHLTTLISFE
jgi:hypothetical protein